MLRALFLRHRFQKCVVSLGLATEGQSSRLLVSPLCTKICQINYYNSQKPPAELSPGTGDEDVLTDKINSADSINNIVNIANSHYSIMNNKHIILTIDILHKFLRKNKGTDGEELNKMELNSFCGQILKRVRHFTPEECVTILRTLTMLNIPSNSAVVQSVCQMIRHSINELSLRTLLFLEFLLQKQTSTPLVDALQLSIPIVLQAQLSTQMDPNNVDELFGCLKVLCRHNSSSSDIEKLCKQIIPRCEELSISRALNLVVTLNEMQLKPASYRATLASVLEFIKNNFSHLSQKEMGMFLFHLEKYPDMSYCCPSLLSFLSHEAKSNDWELVFLSDLASSYRKYKFISMEVLDMIAEKMSRDPDAVAKDRRVSILNLAASFSLADYHPGPFLNAILESTEKLDEMKIRAPHIYLILLGHLAVLDVAPPEMVESVCNETFVSRVYNHEKSVGRSKTFLHHLNTVNQYARLCLENYNGETLGEAFVEEAMRAREEFKMPTADPVLQNFLEVGLGGPRFVLNGLWTRLGHFIDHVIVMRKGDFPVAINKIFDDDDDDNKMVLKYPESNNGFRYIEDLVVPDDAKILAVLVARKDWMANDPPKPTGWATFQQRSLAKMGYNTIIIQPKVVHNLLDREKIPFLMREINHVLREGALTSQCV